MVGLSTWKRTLRPLKNFFTGWFIVQFAIEKMLIIDKLPFPLKQSTLKLVYQ